MKKLDMFLGQEVKIDEYGDQYIWYNGYRVFVVDKDNQYGIKMAATCDEDVIVTDDLLDLPVVAIETVVLHQLGHLINADTKENELTYDEYRYERYLASKKGKILYQVKRADDNIVYNIGKDGAMIGFTMLAEFQAKHYGEVSNVEEIYRRMKRIERTPEFIWNIKKWYKENETDKMKENVRKLRKTIRKLRSKVSR